MIMYHKIYCDLQHMRPYAKFARRRCLTILFFGSFFKIPIYFLKNLVYDKLEQSRKPCVKCCQNGELCGRRRMFQSAIGIPHPLAILDYTPLCKAILTVGMQQHTSGCLVRDHSPCAFCAWVFLWTHPAKKEVIL